ncbi:MAG: urease accessory protein UreF [Burkholderiales bacterium]|nr:MAG: urease accessory protein UreF [Burkholderiales bacterium]
MDTPMVMTTDTAMRTRTIIGTDMGTTTTTTADHALLRILWLASPALPVGGFSYSEGLEAAVDAGLVQDEASASDWITDQLHLGLARSDLPVVAQATRAWRAHDLPRVKALNDWVLHTRETRELRLQTEQMGRSLLDWARSLGELGDGLHERLLGARLDPPSYPVACACALAHGPASERDALVGFAFGWCENLVQAAIKAVPLGQGAGQRILARLGSDIPAAVDHALNLGDDERQAFSPGLAILSARHETQYSRLFRS